MADPGAEFTPERVKALILAQFGGVPPAEQQAAIDWLVAFGARDEAWDVYPVLLGAPDADIVVQFFCSNGLYTKVLQDWAGMTAERREAVHGLMWQLLEACMAANSTVIRRLCLALTSIAIFSERGTGDLCQRAAQIVSSSSSAALVAATPDEAKGHVQAAFVGMELLKYLPEQVEAADISAKSRARVKAELGELAPMLLTLLQSVASAPGSPLSVPAATEDTQEEAMSAFECLKAWVHVDVGVSLEWIKTEFDALWGALLRATQSPLEQLMCGACSTLVQLITYSPLHGELAAGRAEARAAAIADVAAMCSVMRERVAAAEEEGDNDVLWAHSRVVAAVGEFEAEWIGCGSEAAMAMVQLLLELSGRRNRKVAALSFDFWLELDAVPADERHPALGADVFAQLASVLMSQVAYPSTYDPALGWGRSVGGTVDSEDHQQYRDHAGVREVLEAAFNQLRGVFVERMVACLDDPSATWHTHEAALFCLSKVADVAQSLVLDPAVVDAAAVAAKAAVEGQYAMLVTRTAGLRLTLETGAVAFPPVLAQSACAWIKGVGVWLTAATASSSGLLVDALQLPCYALRIPQAAQGAALTLQRLCIACRDALAADTSIVSTVFTALEEATGAGLELSHRKHVLQGIVRVVAAMPVVEATAIVKHLTTPVLARLEAALSGASGAEAGAGTGADASAGAGAGAGAGASQDAGVVGGAPSSGIPDSDAARRSAAAAEIEVLAAAIQFLEFREAALAPLGGVAAHPAVPPVEAAWPMVSRCVELWSADADVVWAATTLYRQCVLSLKTGVGPLVPAIVASVVPLYQAYHYSCCLECVRACIEVFGKLPDTLETFAEAMSAVAATTFEIASAPGGVLEHADVVAEFFEVCKVCVLFVPGALIPSPALTPALQLAAAAVALPKRETVQAACQFVSQLLERASKGGPSVRPLLPALNAVLAELGGALTRDVVVVIVNDGESMPLPHLAQVLYYVLRYCGESGPVWVHAALDEATAAAIAALTASGELRATHPSELKAGLASFTPEDRAQLVSVLISMVGSSLPRFKALVSDFARVCRHQDTKDSLVAYHDVLEPAVDLTDD